MSYTPSFHLAIPINQCLFMSHEMHWPLHFMGKMHGESFIGHLKFFKSHAFWNLEDDPISANDIRLHKGILHRAYIYITKGRKHFCRKTQFSTMITEIYTPYIPKCLQIRFILHVHKKFCSHYLDSPEGKTGAPA